MITARDLEAMDREALERWLVQRVRGEVLDPPLSPRQQETPDDSVLSVHRSAGSEAFRRRLEGAVLGALRTAAERDSWAEGPDAEELVNLAELVQGLDLRDAGEVLGDLAWRRFVLPRGAEMSEAVESSVLYALARLQPPDLYALVWERIWRDGPSRLRALAATGIRRSDPDRALALLPDVVEVARRDPGLPLGEVLWAYRGDARIGPHRFAGALGRLAGPAKERCREALRSVGATGEQVADLLPEAPSADEERLPPWAGGPGCRDVPRPWSVAVCLEVSYAI